MPIYEYSCEKCGNTEEVMQPISIGDSTIKCEKCGGDARRIISSSAFHLKGGGWYTTDYKGCGSTGEKSACNSCPHSDGK